jgi:two-component system phosphate regulon sensor histidine kinase PhoR
MNLHHVALSQGFATLVDEAFSTMAKSPISRELAVDYPEPLALRVQALKVADDAVALWIADVSDIRRLETVRRDFVANVSHELRTPMAAMRAMAETIEDDPDLTNAERDRYLDKIIAEVDRLTHLSDDLLTLASAEAKPSEQAEIDLAEIARYAVLQMEQPAATKGLSLEIDAPTSLIALGDRPRVIQVAMNLLQNAIRYTNSGGAKVRVFEDREHAVLEVQDSGIGIGAEHLPRIFERFYRVDAARSRETGGTGLGLAIVRHITESLGGKVEIESELGKGSTFRVRLPL